MRPVPAAAVATAPWRAPNSRACQPAHKTIAARPPRVEAHGLRAALVEVAGTERIRDHLGLGLLSPRRRGRPRGTAHARSLVRRRAAPALRQRPEAAGRPISRDRHARLAPPGILP